MVHHLLLVAHVAHVGVLVALRALMLVARRVGVGVAWDLVKRPGGVHCLSHLQSFPGWTGRTTTTWFYLMQARYFASKVMKKRCIVLLFYGTDFAFIEEKCVVLQFYGKGFRSFMEKNVSFMEENVSFMEENVSFVEENVSFMEENVSFMEEKLESNLENVSFMEKKC